MIPSRGSTWEGDPGPPPFSGRSPANQLVVACPRSPELKKGSDKVPTHVPWAQIELTPPEWRVQVAGDAKECGRGASLPSQHAGDARLLWDAGGPVLGDVGAPILPVHSDPVTL